MRINLSDYDLSSFNIKEGLFCGVAARLVTPKPEAPKWTQSNKIFRSSIWRASDGELLSASFYRFTNLGESPDHFPPPATLYNARLVEKIDGSTMVVDYLNGQLSTRTRGTFSSATLDNADDFKAALDRYPKIEECMKSIGHDKTLLFEIVSPNQRIVLDYGDQVDAYLIGCVDKSDYSLWPQHMLDDMARLGGFKRPRYYSFDRMDDMVRCIKDERTIEGVCIYSGNDQVIHKYKASRYLLLHRMKSELASLDKVVDLYLSLHRPTLAAFEEYINKTFDYELVTQVRDNLRVVCDLATEANKTLDSVQLYVSTLSMLTKKEAALLIIAEWKSRGLDSLAFTLYNNKTVDDKIFKRLMERHLTT